MGAERLAIGAITATPRWTSWSPTVLAEFDTAKRTELLTRLHEMMNEEAVMIFVAHDLNPRAMSPKVKGFVQAQSWFQDLTPVTVAP